MEFCVGATDVETGRCAYHVCTDGGDEDMLWFRASASMPLVSRPVRIGGRAYLDGGISDAVPYEYMARRGYDRMVIVLTRPGGYRKKPEGTLPVRLLLRRLPKVREAMEHRHEMYNRQMDEIDRREAGGVSLVLRPPEALGIGRTEKNPAELERVYRIGRREASRRLAEIRAFLA